MIAMTPLGRIGAAFGHAPIAVFLPSDESGWLTGEIISLRRQPRSLFTQVPYVNPDALLTLAFGLCGRVCRHIEAGSFGHAPPSLSSY